MGKLINSAVNVFLILLFSKLLGMIKEVSLAANFGTSYIVDAYLIACSLPVVLSSFLYKGIPMSYIPVYSRITDEKERKNFYYNTICIVTSISLVGCLIIYGFPEVFVKLLAPGFSGEVFDLTACLIRIVAFYFPVYTIFELFCTQSAINEEFEFANFCNSIVTNLVLIISIMIAGATTPIVLGYGYVISIIIATFLLGWNLSLRGYDFNWRFFPRDKSFILLLQTAIPAGLSFMANQLNAVIDRMFSSGFGEGGVSSLNFADRLQLLPYTMVVSVILGVCNPRMNRFFSEQDVERGIYYAKISIYFALFISIPIVLFLYYFSESVVSLLFERGKFDRDSVLMTSQCLMLYSIGIPFYSLRQIASNVLAANMKQGLVLKNTVIVVAINIILDFFFARSLGYSGLALATSISGIIAALLMIRDLNGMKINIFDTDIGIDIIKIVVCASISISLGIKFQANTYFASSYSLLISLGVIALIYIFLSVLFKERIIRILLNKIEKRFNSLI